MSRIFLSHSSSDDAAALALHDWLAGEGWEDVFLDVDPDRGIAAGERWERRLYEAASRCEAVVFLVSAHWLASGWCLKEYTTARRLNKKLFAVLIDPDKTIADLPPELTGTWQVTDLSGGQDMQLFRAVRPGSHEEQHVGFSRDGLTRLKRGLRKAGLDPRFFAWPPASDPERAPYRGLKPLEAMDAGVFFGRDAPIVEATDRLRGLGIGAPPRLMVILGASGAGKSSFLRAGLLPRLARDDAHFVALPPLRPERAAITGEDGLLRALETAFPAKTRAELRSAIQVGVAGLRPILAELAQRTFRRTLAEEGATKPPAIVIAIDQAEELFRAEGSEEGQALLGLVRDLTAADDPVSVIVIFAIRSDGYDALEHAKALEGLRQDTIPLLPMPRGAYKEVIEGPVRRVAEAGGKLVIEPQLTDRLLADIEAGGGNDALPLLSFTLEQLYLEYHRAGVLRLADYETIGGFGGAIDRAVARAFARADADPRIPSERTAREALLRRGLIPWLCGIDPDTKSPRRNIARLPDIPAEATPLIDLLVNERLLSTDTRRDRDPITGGELRTATIEPTHEALLRQWGLLDGWLQEDFGLLATLESLKRAARDWYANAQDDAWLAHQGQRLDEAQGLDARPDIAAKLGGADRAYLAACRSRDDKRRAEAEQRRREREEEQERRLADAQLLAAAQQRAAVRTRVGLAAAIVLALVALGFGLYAQGQTSNLLARSLELRRQRDVAAAATSKAEEATTKSDQRAAVLSSRIANALVENGSVDQALLLALQAASRFTKSEAPDITKVALYKAIRMKADNEYFSLHRPVKVFDLHRAILLFDIEAHDLYLVKNDIVPTLIYKGGGQDSDLVSVTLSDNDDDLFLLRSNLDVEEISISGKKKRISRHFPFEGITDTDAEQKIKAHSDGMFTLVFLKEQQDGKKPFLKVYSLLSGASIEMPLPPNAYDILYGKDSNNRKSIIFVPTMGDKPPRLLLNVLDSNNAIELDTRVPSEEDQDAVRYGRCVDPTRPAMIKALSSAYEDTSTSYCHSLKTALFYTTTRNNSAGVDRSDGIIKADGTIVEPLKSVNSHRVVQVPAEEAVEWADALEDPTSQPNTTFALVSHRDVVVANEDGITFDTRHPAIPDAAHLIDSNQILVVEGLTGTITRHSFGARSKVDALPLYTSEGDDTINQNKPIRPLHYSCNVAGPSPLAVILPGSKTVSVSEDRDNKTFTLNDGHEKTELILPFKADCFSFSIDFKKVGVWSYFENHFAVYNFDKAIADKSFKGAEIETPPAKKIISMFIEDDGSFLLTDYSSQVTRWQKSGDHWRSSIAYQGDFPVAFAEPDQKGGQLLVIENKGEQNLQGWLYSVEAQEKWLNLGSDYKWLRISFDKGGNIFSSKMEQYASAWTIKSTRELMEFARTAISPSCASTSKELENSPCWPRDLEVR